MTMTMTMNMAMNELNLNLNCDYCSPSSCLPSSCLPSTTVRPKLLLPSTDVCPQAVCPQLLFSSTVVLLNYAYAMTMTMTMTVTTVGSRSMKAPALDGSSSRWRGISGSDPYKDLSVGQLLDYTRSLYQQMDVPGFAFQPAGQGGRSSLPVWQWGVCWLWLPAPRSRSKKSPINLKQF